MLLNRCTYELYFVNPCSQVCFSPPDFVLVYATSAMPVSDKLGKQRVD